MEWISVKESLPKKGVKVRCLLSSHISADVNERQLILCECCGAPAVDIHHIEPRSSFGSKRKGDQDDPSNLIALCRDHHDLAHGKDSRLWKIAFKKLVSESFTRFDRVTN